MASVIINPVSVAHSMATSHHKATKEPSSSSTSRSPEPSTKTFHRLKASLEQSLRRGKKDKDSGGLDINQQSNDRHQDKPRGLRKLESKVTFRLTAKDSPNPTTPVKPKQTSGFSSFVPPSLRGASMSSPALHLAQDNNSRSVTPSPNDPLKRDRSRRTSIQPASSSQISSPSILAKRPSKRVSSPIEPTTSSHLSRQTSSRHRSSQSQPINLTSPSTPTLTTSRVLSRTPESPLGPTPEPPTPPETPTPTSSRVHLSGTSRRAAQSSGHLPLSPSPTPSTPRGISPLRPRDPSSPTRSRIVTPRGLSSSSTSHLPPSPTSPTHRRGSIDGPKRPLAESPRRTSFDAPRRPSLDSPRRPSIDNPRRASGELARRPTTRNESPSPAPSRLRPAISPTPGSPRSVSQQHYRQMSVSTSSLISPSNPEYRELIRIATSMLLKEVAKPPIHVGRNEAALRDWNEVEARTRALSRLERIWGKSGAGGSSTNLHNGREASSSGLSAAGEERERKLFCESLRDGFVLCQLMNKLRASSIVKPDPREDGFARTSNVTKFLAACASYGLSSDDLFLRDDLLEATGESLARVAKTIIALIKFAENPQASRSKVLTGQAKRLPTAHGPYGQTSSRAAASSVPNLSIAQRSVSPSHGPTSPTRKRYSPPEELGPVRSHSPSDPAPSSSKSDKGRPEDIVNTQKVRSDEENDRTNHRHAHVVTPPPKSPLRRKRAEDEGNGLFNWAINAMSPSRSSTSATSVASSGRATIGDDASTTQESFPDATIRQSVASNSTAMTDTTVTTAVSSILDAGRTFSNGFRFGTIRTVTTDATSDPPSVSRAEGSLIADDLRQKQRGDPSRSPRRERRITMDNPVVDLTLVAEEESGGSTGSGLAGKGKGKGSAFERDGDDGEGRTGVPLRLGKGKWPDDFIDAFQGRSPSRPPKSPAPEHEIVLSSSPVSITPPRKLAIVGASRKNDSVESLQQFPRRPSHRARHSIDAPTGGSSLLPKESILRRDVSPDGSSSSGSKVMLRRHSTKPGPRNGAYVPRGSLDENRASDDNLVPFPRSASGSSPKKPSPMEDKPHRPVRGRFQSDMEATTLRRPRPNSYDELGANRRSRFESMVNLGGASSNASASDLLNNPRDSLDGSAVRKTLIIKDVGKPATHFQLGNCIGRGQFGSVYRALNLNTGQMVAVKRIRLEGLKEDEVTQLMREVDLVKRLSHPSIVKYEGMARDEDTLSIVLEYAENGSLGQTLKAFGKLNERLVASYVVKILEGLHYLHQSDVVHCDLKAANILTTKNGNVKLSDFGVSLNLRAMEREIKDVAGTPNWMAPEVIELKGASTKSDIWSLGCTVVELLTGRPPYAEIANSMSVMFRIVEDARPPLPEQCSPLLQDFLLQCFDKEPSNRPSADVLCEHEWLKTNWVGRQELRPQDSIPFLRRVSADYQKVDKIRFDAPEIPPSPKVDQSPRSEEAVSSSPPRNRRLSSSSQRPPIGDHDISPREHSFVKTTFSKPMICRVCLLNVKKSAVLCSECSLIAHAKCSVNAPPTCDLRSQLLQYAQYAEKGNPNSAYSNPLDQLEGIRHPGSPMSDVSYVAHSPRTSFDISPPLPPPTPILHQSGNVTPSYSNPANPPTAFKFFKRPRPSQDPIQPGTPKEPAPRPHKLEKGAKKSRETARSLKSNSTHDHSIRSNGTHAESLGSSRHARSADSEADEVRSSQFTTISSSSAHGDGNVMQSIPGGLAGAGDGVPSHRRHKRGHESKSSGNCAVQ